MYSKYFASSSENCPIVKYELVKSLNGDPFELPNVKMNSNWSLSINERISFKS